MGDKNENHVFVAGLNDIKAWLAEGLQNGATHMIVVWDSANYENYRLYVMPDEDIKAKCALINSVAGRTVDEVYNFSIPIEKQLKEFRAYHIDNETNT